MIAGNIGITGFVRNGNSQFAFVNTTAGTIPAGTVIYFTNYSFDASTQTLVSTNQTVPAGAVTEGTVAYTVGAGGLAPYTTVIIGNFGNAVNQLQGGSVALSNGGAAGAPWLIFNKNGSGDKVIAYVASSPISAGGSVTGATFLSAVIFGPDSWFSNSTAPVNCYDSALPSGLTSGVNATDLSTLWNSSTVITGASAGGNQNAVLSSCQTTLAGIVAPGNWTANVTAKTAFSLTNSYAHFGPTALPTGTGTPTAPIGVASCAPNNAGNTMTTATIVIGVNTATPTSTATSASTSTFTPTPSFTFTSTVTNTASATTTNTAAATATNTVTDTNTSTITNTPQVTNTATNTATGTPTNTGTVTPLTATNTATNTSTATFTSTPTFTNTVTNSPTVTSTATNTATSTFTSTVTDTYTSTITNTPQATSTPSNTFTVTSTATTTTTNTFTSTPTATPSFTATSTGTLGTPTSTATSTPTSTKTVTPTVTPTATTAPIEIAQKVVTSSNQSVSCDLSNGAGVQAPAGVFSAGTTLTVEEFAPSSAPPTSSGFRTIQGNIYTFDASSGNTDNFSTPVTLTFPVSASVLAKYSDQQLQVAYFNTTTNRWETLNTIVDRRHDLLSVVTNHFSMWTVVAEDFLSSTGSGGGNILAPVPANSGDSVCLYTGQALSSSTWTVYSVAGYRIASLNFTNQTSQCWTAQVGRGLYYVKLVLNFVDGTSTTEWHKVIVK